MRLRWTRRAFADVDRVFDFLAVSSPPAAERVVRNLFTVPNILIANPYMGPVVEELEGGQVRRLMVGAYEVRYHVSGNLVEILRVFHAKEDR